MGADEVIVCGVGRCIEMCSLGLHDLALDLGGLDRTDTPGLRGSTLEQRGGWVVAVLVAALAGMARVIRLAQSSKMQPASNAPDLPLSTL